MERTKQTRFLLALLLAVSTVMVCPTFLHAQQKPSEKFLAGKKDRQDKVIGEIVSFFENEMKNKDAAKKIKDWYKEGKIVFGPTDIGIAHYHGGKITIREDFVDSMVDKKDGTVKFGDIISLSSSLVHEFTHADQSWIYWGRSENTNWLFGYHPAELDAYAAAWGAIQGWISTAKSQLDAMPKGATACDKAPQAAKVQQLCGAFVNYYEAEMKSLDVSKRPDAMRRLEKLETEISVKEKELASLRQQQSDMEGLLGSFNRIARTLDEKRDSYAEVKKQIAEKEKEIGALKKEAGEIKEKTWLDLSKHTWTTPGGKKVSNEEALKLVKQLAREMQDIVAECEKEKRASASSAKDPASLTDKERAGLFHDLCRCSCNPTVGGGSKYDPARGCVCSGPLGGEWTVPMISSGDCFERAAAAAGVDSKKLAGEIHNDNYEHYKNLIEEARKIMEEYLGRFGLNRMKSELEGSEESSDYLLLAANLDENSVSGEILYSAAASKGSVSSYVKMVKEKNGRGDPDRALALVRAAEAMMPDRKASGETINILSEFAIIMAKTALNIVTDLEFDEGLYLLRKAAEFYKGPEQSMAAIEIRGLTQAFEKWKKDWDTIQTEVPRCLTMIKEKKVCECERLDKEKITPASNSFVVYGQASPQKWEITAASGQPRPIPKKDKLMADLKGSLAPAKQKCASHPAMKTQDMAQLKGYEQYKFLEKSPFMNKEDFRSSSTHPISDEQAIKKAEKLLAEPGLCDCERDRIEAILETARKDFKFSHLEVDLTANRESLVLGEYVRVHLSIKGGRKPYSYSMTGDLTANVKTDPSPGLVTEYAPKTPGTKTIKALVTDAAGDSRTVSVSFKVLQPKGSASSTDSSGRSVSSQTSHPVYDPTKDPNYSGKKGAGKQIDIASVDKAGKEFVDATAKTKKPDVEGENPQVIAQPETYTGGGQKTPEEEKSKMTTKPPYPPYGLDEPDNTGRRWTSLPRGGTGGSTRSSSAGSSGSYTWGPSSSSGSSTTGSSTTSTPSTDAESSSSAPSLIAVYENKSDANVHIFTQGENFSPSNRLAPGEKRTVSLKMPPDGRIKFISGRNGQVISSKYWNGDAGDLNRYPMVRFVKGMGGKEELSITTNLK